MKKQVFVINGSGGVGKDTICEAAAKFWRVRNVSSITPIVNIARFAGWDGQKTKESRRMLSRLKEVFTEYNDLPLQYCLDQLKEFQQSDEEILFIHIREPKEIKRFVDSAEGTCKTILVQRRAFEKERGTLGNRSDDEVEQYPYDYYFDNSTPLEALPEAVHRFFAEITA